MKLTSKSEYGLLALIYLARQERGVLVSSEAIAKAQKIPPSFLEQLLLVLKRAGMVGSARGSRGGYKLAKNANLISIAEVVRLFDGALAPTTSVSQYFYEPTPIEKEERLVAFFDSIAKRTSQIMEATTIAHIL